MYARRVTMQLKPGNGATLTAKIENEILPLLRKAEGFQDHLTFISPDEVKAFGISLWDTKEHAEAYAKSTFPQVEKILTPLVDGTTHIGGFNVATSTFHKVGTKPSTGAPAVVVAAVVAEAVAPPPATVPA